VTAPIDRIRPADLETEGERLDHEVATAYAVARQLESELLPTEAVTPMPGFAERVMAAVAREPRPRPAAFLAPLRRRSLAGVRESVATAWRIALGAAMPVQARATALAYVLAVLLVAGSATTIAAYGAAGALGWLGTAPAVSPGPSGPDATPAPTNPLAEPGESTEPSASSDPEDSTGPDGGPTTDPGDTSGARPSPTSNEGATSSPGGTHEDSATPSPSASADATDTPRPSGTPKASQTPEPSKTPSPTSSSHG